MRALWLAFFVTFGMLSGAQAQCDRPWDVPWDARTDLRMMWLTKACRYDFPKRDGFAGTPRMIVLKPGTVIDRFGYPGGRFLAPADASYMGRAIPYDRLKMPYYRYQVARPLRVAAGKAAPWFDQPGGGIQYMTSRRISELVASGHLKQVW